MLPVSRSISGCESGNCSHSNGAPREVASVVQPGIAGSSSVSNVGNAALAEDPSASVVGCAKEWGVPTQSVKGVCRKSESGEDLILLDSRLGSFTVFRPGFGSAPLEERLVWQLMNIYRSKSELDSRLAIANTRYPSSGGPETQAAPNSRSESAPPAGATETADDDFLNAGPPDTLESAQLRPKTGGASGCSDRNCTAAH